MVASIVETPLSPGSALYNPSMVARATDGAVWSVAYGLIGGDAPYSYGYGIQRTDEQGVTSVETTLGYAEVPKELLTGREGAIWALVDVAYGAATKLVKLTDDDSLTVPLPEHAESATIDRDGDVWISSPMWGGLDGSRTTLREYDVDTGLPTRQSIVREDQALFDVVAATDDAFWFSTSDGRGVARLTASGDYNLYDVALTRTAGLVAGSDGRVWVGGQEAGDGFLVSVAPDGGFTRIGLGTALSSVAGQFPRALAGAADGAVWYLDDDRSVIGHVDLEGSSTTVPMLTLGDAHLGLASDAGTGAFFTNNRANAIGHLTHSAADSGVIVAARSFHSAENVLPATTTIANFSTSDSTAIGSDFIARYQIEGYSPRNGVVLPDGNGGFIVQAGNGSDVLSTEPKVLSVTIIDVKNGNLVGANATAFGLVTHGTPPITVVGQTFTAFAGAPFVGVVGRINDPAPVPGPEGLTTGTIDWGDGSALSTFVIDPTTPVPTFELGEIGYRTGGHVYAASGTYTVTITATHDDEVYTASSTANVSVAPVENLVGNPATFNAGTAGRALVATFTTSPIAAPSTYAATVTWPGGSVAGEILATDSNYEVWATINFAAGGTIPLTVSVSPASGGAGAQTQVVAVITAAPIVGTPGSGSPGGGTPGPGTPGSGAPVGSPRVTASVAQFLARRGMRVVLTYSDAIDASRATTLARYRITEAGRDGKFGTRDDRRVRVNRATYDAQTHQVTLAPRGSFARSARFQVTITDELTVTALAAGRRRKP